MKSKFTPGPWTATSADLGGDVPSWKVYSKEGQHVASVHRWNGIGDEENARLIAAAPDILKALQACAIRLDRITSSGNVHCFGEDQDALDLARSSLHKAGII